MKKIVSLFVLAIFLIGIAPFAFAEENATGNDVQKYNDKLAAQKKQAEEAKQNFEQKRAEFIQQAQAKRHQLIEKREQARTHLSAKVMELREKRNVQREKYLTKKADLIEKAVKARERKAEAKEKHLQAKDRLQEKKEQLKTCKGNETEECIALRADAKKDAKEFLSNVADRVLAMLERTKDRIENSKLSDAKKTTLLDQIEVKMAEIASIQDVAESLNENSTKEEIAEAAKTIKDVWKETKDVIKKGAGLAAADRMGGILVKTEHLQAKLEKAISKLKEKGTDVSAAEDLKTDFDGLLARAKNLQEEAKALFIEGKVPEAAQKVQEAHAALKEAHSKLKEIVRELKGTKEGIEALEATEESTGITGTAAITGSVTEGPEAEENAAEETETADESAEAETPDTEEDAEDEQPVAEEIESPESAEGDTEAEQ